MLHCRWTICTVAEALLMLTVIFWKNLNIPTLGLDIKAAVLILLFVIDMALITTFSKMMTSFYVLWIAVIAKQVKRLF